MRATSVIAFAAALVPAVLAGPAFTAPVASTVCHAGQPCVITWNDDGKAPLLAEFGDCSVGVYTGSAQQQTMMQNLGFVNPASAGTIQFVPDPAMGENSSSYFIKMVSMNTADPAMPQYKASAYSAMFTLDGMTGKFSPEVQAQIAGTAASSGAGTSQAPATTALGSTSISTVRVTATSSSRATTTATAAGSAATGASNSASSVAVGMGMFGASVLAALAAIF